MKKCFICGTENGDDFNFCKNCGRRIAGKKTCDYCGSVIDADCVFCPRCGKRLEKKVKTTVTTEK